MHASERLSLIRLRRRLPLPVFVLVLVLLVVMLGLVCLCISDHPSQAAERALSAAAHAPALVTIWAFFVVLLAPSLLLLPAAVVSPTERASPSQLQRFRF